MRGVKARGGNGAALCKVFKKRREVAAVVEHADNLNSCFSGEVKNRIGKVGEREAAEATKLAGRSWPELADIRKA